MTRLRLGISIVFIAAALSCSVRMSAVSKRGNILEIFTDNSGLFSPAGRRPYAIVHKDGTLDYMDRGEKAMVTRRRRLTSQQLMKLRILLDGTGVVAAEGLIIAPDQPTGRDYQTNLDVSIRRDGRQQSFVLRGFEPDAGRPFPKDIATLLCYVDELRDASYKVSSGCK